jgi:hypothetical protein
MRRLCGQEWTPLARTLAAGLACFALAGCCHELAPDRRPTSTSGWAILTGAAESSSDGVTKTGVQGRIMAIDGHRMCLRANAELAVAPGCYLVETDFEYTLRRRDRTRPCVAFKVFGACDRFSDYDAGRSYFALPIVAGRRYELSALIDGDYVWTHFVEVDPQVGTISRFPPVDPRTRTCSPGIPVGAAAVPLRETD